MCSEFNYILPSYELGVDQIKVNGRRPCLELIYLFYLSVYLLWWISEFNWENLQREFSFFMSFYLRTEHHLQPFLVASHCYMWWKMGFACHQKMKKTMIIAKWETSANTKTRTSSARVLVLCQLEYEWCRPLWASGTQKNYHCRHLLPATMYCVQVW